MPNQVAYGFNRLKDVFDRRVTEIGASVVREAIEQSVEEHNRQMAALMDMFVMQTTDFKIKYRTPPAARLQPMDEHGRAQKLRSSTSYEVAFPLQMAGGAVGATYRAKTKMTVAEMNDDVFAILSADVRWVRDHILAALFANTSWTFQDEEHGALTIKGLANGDTDTYQVRIGADDSTTDDHYLAQAAAIDDSNDPFQTIYDELDEHPENAMGEVVALVPTNLKNDIEALSAFLPRPDMNVRRNMSADELVMPFNVETPGDFLGYHSDRVWIAEWKSLPSNYIVATTVGGSKPLGMREEPETELQGFHRAGEISNYPFTEEQWVRIAGFGAWNRVGALVYQIGSGSYSVPSGYTSPMG